MSNTGLTMRQEEVQKMQTKMLGYLTAVKEVTAQYEAGLISADEMANKLLTTANDIVYLCIQRGGMEL